MSIIRTMALALAGASVLLAVGCTSDWHVDRVDPRTTVDYDYRFDDEDARQVYEGMVADCLSRPWIDTWRDAHAGAKPIVVLGTVRNDTADYLDTKLFTTRIQQELINSTRVRVKAERDWREELRQERLDVEFNDPATVKAYAKEINADYMMLGRIGDVQEVTRTGKKRVQYYQVNLELIDVETAEKVWIGTEEIKKVAKRY